MKKSAILLAVALVVAIAGCATTVPGASQDLLKFLQMGKTTRQEVLLKLGQPSAAFEQEKILTYRIGQDSRQNYYLVTPKAMTSWQTVRYSLVLVFDAHGMLEKQSLVLVQ